MVSGVPALELYNVIAYETPQVVIYLLKDDYIYDFLFSVEDERVARQIISTFRFIEIVEKSAVGILEAEQLVLDFCSQYKDYGETYVADDRYWKPDVIFFIDFDGRGKKEILGTCGYGSFGGSRVLFVFDAQGKELLKAEKLDQPMRFYTFENIRVMDVSNDGRDEIIYKESGWHGSGANNMVYLYSSGLNEWMWIAEEISYILEKEKWERKYSFSPNLELPKNKIFKEFLVQEIQEWNSAPLRHYLSE